MEIKKFIYLLLTSIVVIYRKILIAKSEKKIGRLEVKLISQKQSHKELLKTTESYCNKVLKVERNM